MTFSIGLRTITRPKVAYLSQTLTRLIESGTLTHPDLLGLHVSHGEGLTPNQNGVRALRRAAKDEAEWVIFLEDDIDVVNDFLGSVGRWLTKFATPEVLAYPLGCFYPSLVLGAMRRGAWDMPVDHFYGSQALAFRTEDAVSYAEFLTGLHKPAADDLAFDIHVQYWHRARKPEQAWLRTPAPCLIDHIGEYSVLGPPESWARVGHTALFGGREYSFRG